MTVELKTDKHGFVWATKVQTGSRIHLTCMSEETAEALRVALNARYAEQRREKVKR